jgi:ATP-dependent DNA helicase PIF1
MKFYFINSISVVKLATSGQAARLIDGETLHGSFCMDYDNGIHLLYKSVKWYTIQGTDVIIIDEISMLNEYLLATIDNILRGIQADFQAISLEETSLFGGKSIILMGDLLQLPPVSTLAKPAKPLHRSNLFLNNFTPLLLNVNVRQGGCTEFQAALNNFRVGKLSADDIVLFNSRICGVGHVKSSNCVDVSMTKNLVSVHKERREIVNFHGKNKKDIIQLLSRDIDSSGVQLTEKFRRYIDKAKGSLERSIQISPGEGIVLIKNIDVKEGIVNGLLGTYIKHNDKVLLMKTVEGKLIIIPKMKQKVTLEYSNVHVFRIQFPILNSIALTIHRSQGLTLNGVSVAIDNKLFCTGQAYVAVSRVKQLEDLHLLSFDPDSIKVDFEVVQLYEYISLHGTMKNFKYVEPITLNSSQVLSDEVFYKNESISSMFFCIYCYLIKYDSFKYLTKT